MGTTAKDSIPLHRLDDRTNQGFEVDKVDSSNWQIEDAILLGTHRDDHYIFLIQERGLSKVMIDFSYFILKGMSVLFILPGQEAAERERFYRQPDQSTGVLGLRIRRRECGE